MTGDLWTGAPSPDAALGAAVVRVRGADGTVGGAGFLVAPDLVLTCAHVVSDALGRPRDEDPTGSGIAVDLPLADLRTDDRDDGRTDDRDSDRTDAPTEDDPRQWPAVVEHWVPIRTGRAGDIALLRLREAVPGARPLPMADPESVLEHGALAVGFTGGEPAETWFKGRFSGATSEGWLQVSRADRESAYIKRGFSGSPVWDVELGAVVGVMVAAQPEQDAQQGYVLRTRTILREIPELAVVVRPPSPFPGLEAFQETDADAYFGRAEDVEKIVMALKGDQRVVTVYGPSGCGKSSLALAGVVPRMRRDGYEVLTLNAGQISSPRAALATELSRATRSDPDRVERWLTDLGLADTLHRVRGKAGGKLVVVLDQAEALLGDDAETKMNECADLLFSQQSPAGGLRVLVVLRADFMDAVLKHPRLGPALRDGTALPLTPMTREQLEAAITRPLDRLPAVTYDPGLDQRILNDTGGDPGILPLLGFVLQQLWERQAGGRLLTSEYEAMRGVSGALESHSETAWKACVGGREAVEKEALALLTGLVRMLPGGTLPLRRRLSRQEAGEERWRIAQSLAERRLLVLHGGEGEPETAELAHESLIATWPTLRQQVKADAQFLAGRAELGHDRDRWERDGRPAGLLPGALQLLVVRGWLHGREGELTDAEREFLAHAQRHSKRLRARIRAAWTASALVLALIAGLGTFLVYQSGVSERRLSEGRSRTLATLSDGMSEANPGLAALSALAAYDVSPTQEARSALLRRYDGLRDTAFLLSGVRGDVSGTAMSSDGRVTLVTTERGLATLFVRTAAGRVLRKQLGLTENAYSPVVSRDGRKIAYVQAKTDAMVWHDVDPSAPDILGPGQTLHGGELKEVTFGALLGDHHIAAFSPGGNLLAAVAFDKRLRLWDLKTGQLRQLPDRMPDLEQVWFGPNEDTLVGKRSNAEPGSLDTAMVSIDLRTGATRELLHSSSANLGVSGNGSVLAVCEESKDGDRYKSDYRAVSAADGRELNRYTPEGSYTSCEDPALDDTGEHVAVHDQGNWALLDTRPGKEAQRFEGPDRVKTGNLPLLGSPSEPVVVSRGTTAVTGLRLSGTDGVAAYSPPQLLDHGNKMVVRAGKNGDRLRVLETAPPGRTLAEVTTDATTPPGARDQALEINRSQTLVADVADENRIVVRALPDLHKVTEFKTAPPPAAKDGEKKKLVSFRFLGDNDLVTDSGTLVEHWSAETGQRLSPAFDVGDLAGDAKEMPDFFVSRHPRPGHVQVTLDGDPIVHAFDLEAGKEDQDLRIDLGRQDVITIAQHPDGRYALVLTTGSMVELWSVQSGQRLHRIQGPLGPLDSDRWTAGALKNSGFYLANGNSVLFLRDEDPSHNETYDLGEKQGFLDGIDGGMTLLRTPPNGGRLDVLRLDPRLWKRHLCAVLGRDLTEDERTGLPPGLPKTICPA
ncbi:trypsin-like peptidase domain-containing protein [Streptomyces sp. NBC_00454]|uniref:nSTAND1 domain-containing NTPase n=1 Tax=Streptomyces sp. NBC_00454 TaxID=2975747 RepID=UPI0030E02143